MNTVSKVATDLENLVESKNLKETGSVSQGLCLNSQGICDRIICYMSENFVV